ncbi:hypothetical protein ABZ345_35610 [Lentzea sp. NPDC005914]|uniref:hypothetical protein n=1 Tax=Lentzea sp. NPDC005914 TaxID=3154572 RepID=UPI00340062D4
MASILRLAAVVVLMAGLTAGTAHACECVSFTEAQMVARADHVFQARVLSKSEEPDQMMRYRVVVSKERKGDVPRYLSVISHRSSATCGVEFVVGKDYLIYATGDAKDRRVETHLCGGTRVAGLARPACGN